MKSEKPTLTRLYTLHQVLGCKHPIERQDALRRKPKHGLETISISNINRILHEHSLRNINKAHYPCRLLWQGQCRRISFFINSRRFTMQKKCQSQGRLANCFFEFIAALEAAFSILKTPLIHRPIRSSGDSQEPAFTRHHPREIEPKSIFF